MVEPQRPDRSADPGLGALELDVSGSLGHVPAHIDPDQPERQRQQEGHPPRLAEQGVIRQAHHLAGHEQTRGEPQRQRCCVAGTEEPAAAGRGVLHQKDRRHAELATRRQPLCDPQADQRQGGGKTDRGVARQQTDECGCRGHQRDDDHQHPLTPAHVSTTAEEHGADRTDEERCAVERERRQQNLIIVWEEHRNDHGAQGAVDGEVVPLHGVADGPSNECSSGGGSLDGPNVARRDHVDRLTGPPRWSSAPEPPVGPGTREISCRTHVTRVRWLRG